MLRRIKTEMPSPTTKSKPESILKVWAPPEPFYFEAYMYEKNAKEDGFIHGIRQYLKNSGTDDYPVSETFDNANFTRLVSRRIPHSANLEMKSPNGYNRFVIIRQLGDPENPSVAVPSTVETRKEGLAALKSFLKDPRFSKYPVNDSLQTLDITADDSKMACDTWLMDSTIQEMMETDIDSDILTAGFVEEFPDVAKFCWAGPNFSDWARELGFGSE